MKFLQLVELFEDTATFSKKKDVEEEENVMDKLPPVPDFEPKDDDTDNIGEVEDDLPEIDPVTDEGTESDDEVRKLVAQHVQVTKQVLNNEPILRIKSMLDPNMNGYVKYEDQADLDLAYDNLVGDGEENIDLTDEEIAGRILSYMHRNSRNRSTAFLWADILAKEILTIKRDLSAEEIGELKLDFKI